MPPVVTGAIVAMIGLNLAPTAWDGGGDGGVKAQPLIALVTLAAILITTVAFRGFLGRLSILLGVAVGWAYAAATGRPARRRPRQPARRRLDRPARLPHARPSPGTPPC